MDTNGRKGSAKDPYDENTCLFTHIFDKFTNLRMLNLGPSSIWYQYLSFNNSSPTVISSTLQELYVGLEYFTDCLYLLDGRFDQLRKFHINIDSIEMPVIMNNMVKYFVEYLIYRYKLFLF